ncbi:MAG: putative xanthine dehydrogenase subunit A [Pelotomaculum sp. PtaB.Bin104]|nr:MAG: putative xanthine dehydrogenase subunit A [Pelotomaculum sp. PtaB.Bin104]
MDMKLIDKLFFIGRDGEDAALVTIMQTNGSTPRNPGTKMLVFKDGRCFGTIGGGSVEAEAKKEALAVLGTRKSKKYRLGINNAALVGDGMICGGSMEVWIDLINSRDMAPGQVFPTYLKAIKRKENLLLVTITAIDEGKRELVGRKMAFLPGSSEAGDLGVTEITEQARIIAGQLRGFGKPQVIALPAKAMPDKIKDVELFFEPGPQAPHLLILGGGHIALPLVRMAAILGYQTTVVDDRPAFASATRFPEAGQVICAGFVDSLKELEIDRSTYIVIVTYSHKLDLDCLREVIQKPAAYRGMVGSARKIKVIFDKLESEGVSKEQLKEIYSPIGLDIGAETPEEIALCILAEIVKVWRGGNTK